MRATCFILILLIANAAMACPACGPTTMPADRPNRQWIFIASSAVMLAMPITLAGGFAFEAPPAKYNRKIYEANLALMRGAPIPAPLAALLTAEAG